jgi:hypothetical protein
VAREAERSLLKLTAGRVAGLRSRAAPVAEEAVEIDPATAQALAPSCPCCGGRKIIIEIFARGCQLKHRPTPAPAAIRIDTS